MSFIPIPGDDDDEGGGSGGGGTGTGFTELSPTQWYFNPAGGEAINLVVPGGSLAIYDVGTDLAANVDLNLVAGATLTFFDVEGSLTLNEIRDGLGGGGTTVRSAKTIHTAGNISINNTAWTDLGVADLVLTAAIGDIVLVGLSAYVIPNGATQWAFLDVASIVSAAAVNYWSNGTGTPAGEGVPAWEIAGNRGGGPVGGSVMKTIVSGDLSGGTLTLRLRFKTANAVVSTVYARAENPLQFWAVNLGAL